MSAFEVSDEAREAAWDEYRDGPEYAPTDRYAVRPVFDAGWNATVQSRDHRIAELDNAVSDLLRERDEWEERLTALCYAIAPVEQIGEWSSANELDESAAEAAAQIRAERDAALARVQELELFQVAHADLYRRYLAALAVIEKARDEIRFEEVHRILATVDTSALAARDAEKWDEGWEAANEYLLEVPGLSLDPPVNPYRARAEKGADTRTAEEREAAYWAGAGCEEDDRG